MAEGISKQTTYNIIKTFEERGNTTRKRDSGHVATIMTEGMICKLKMKLLCGKKKNGQRALSTKFGCT